MNHEEKKHMTLDDRIEIQECMNKGMTFKKIASRIGKDPTTVSKRQNIFSEINHSVIDIFRKNVSRNLIYFRKN